MTCKCNCVVGGDTLKNHQTLTENTRLLTENITLRRQLAEKDEEIESFKSSYESTYEQNLRLANQLGESEAERLEQARLLGMSGEREAGLLAEIERLDDEVGYHSQWKTEFRKQKEYAEKQLAASQAREQKLRNALTWIANVNAMDYEYVEVARKSLDIASDTTALDQFKAQVAHEAGEVMRERCAKELLPDVTQRITSPFRSIPSVTLDDIK